MKFIEIVTVDDVAQLQSTIEDIVDGWYSETRIDWENFLDRIEDRGFDLGSELDSPVIREIKRRARAYKKL